jgi:hypothetical protein
MKKGILLVIVLIFSICHSYSQETFVNGFLENYFGTKDYSVMNYTLSGTKVVFAYKKNKSNSEVFDKGIIFRIENKQSVKPLIYFLGNNICNSDRILFSGKIETQLFWGWSIYFVEKNGSFSTKFYTDDGTYVTEGPIFIWDAVNLKFKQYEIDKSMM